MASPVIVAHGAAESTIAPACRTPGAAISPRPAGRCAAHASAGIYSLVETAKANGHEPHSYLCKVLRDLPAAKTVEDIEALLPWNLAINDLISAAAR